MSYPFNVLCYGAVIPQPIYRHVMFPSYSHVQWNARCLVVIVIIYIFFVDPVISIDWFQDKRDYFLAFPALRRHTSGNYSRIAPSRRARIRRLLASPWLRPSTRSPTESPPGFRLSWEERRGSLPLPSMNTFPRSMNTVPMTAPWERFSIISFWMELF